MRQNTIKLWLRGKQFRRSTKHVKYGRQAYNQAKKWDLLLDLYGYQDSFKNKNNS